MSGQYPPGGQPGPYGNSPQSGSGGDPGDNGYGPQPGHGQPGHGQPDYGQGTGYGQPGPAGPPPPGYGAQPTPDQQPGYGGPPPGYGAQPGYGGQQPGYGSHPGAGSPQTGAGSPPSYGQGGYHQSPGATAGSPGTPGYLAGPAGPQTSPGGPQTFYGGTQTSYGAPQDPYGGQPGPYGGQSVITGPPPKKRNTKLLMIIGVGALVLIVLGVVGGVVLFRNAQEAAAAKPPAAVQGYLEAVAAGQADAALAYAAQPPKDKSLITDEVLRESRSRAAITAISVPVSKTPPEGTTTTVEATYKLGDEPVTQRFTLTKVEDDWKLNEAYATVDLTKMKLENLPMLINGVKTEADSAQVLPGSYELTTGIEAIGYGEDKFLVTSLTEAPTLPATTATLTDAGNKALISAGKASLKACLAAQDLSPTNCPNKIRPLEGQVITPGSIRWATSDDTWQDFKAGLVANSQGGYVAKGKLGLKFTFAASGSYQGRATTFDNDNWSNQWRYFFLNADLTKEPMNIVWVGPIR